MSEANTTKLSAAVLGQLLLMQNVLCNLPGEESIFQFVCRGLADLPGVAEAEINLTGDAEDPSLLRFPMGIGSETRGELHIRVSDRAAFAPYEPYLRNFLFMVAVILEERRQRRLNVEHQTLLEDRVRERTQQLTQEIAERTLIEDELRLSRNMLAHMLDSIPQGVFWKDREGVYLGCNQTFAHAVGLNRAEDVIGKTDFDLPWSRSEAEAYRKVDRSVIDTRETRRHMVETLRQSDGSCITVDTTKVPLIDEHSDVYGVLGVYDDISERLQAEEERERLQEQLIQAQKMESIGRLAGGVAHDFNNMLQTIIGNADMVLNRSDSATPLSEHLNEILKAARRSADLTRQLLAFARKQAVVPRVLDLNDSVASVLKLLSRLISEDTRLVWLPGVNLWPIRIDPVQIDQILANLTVNARDAISGAGQITIETANQRLDGDSGSLPPELSPGDYVRLTVRDTGCGMDPETMEHLFEPFFTTKPEGQGTGLGLATIYGIVRQNQGHIEVRSERGQGSEFTINLPRCATPVESESSGVAETSADGTETVLLVEDEGQILRLGQRILEAHGYNVLAARTPEQALQLAAEIEGPIHLVITDVIMPALNGRELLTRLDVMRPGIRCLFISGYTADVIAKEGVLDEGVQFLQKPFTVDDLARKVRSVLDQVESPSLGDSEERGS